METRPFLRKSVIRTVGREPPGYLDLVLEDPVVAALAGPGQFVMLRFAQGSDPLLARPFDIVATHPETGTFRLIIKIVGSATKIMESMRAGDRADVIGPLGAPITDFACSSLGLVVRGCGAAAVLLFLKEAHRRRIAVHTVLSAATAAKLLLADELAALSQSLRLATDDGSAGEKALGTDVLRQVLAGTAVDRVYSCGGGPFYLPFLKEWEAGHPDTVYLFLESYMACGFGHCHGCAVPKTGGGYALACREGPLFKLREVKEPCLIYQ